MATRKTAPSDTLTIACKLPQGLRIPLPTTGGELVIKGAGSPGAHSGHGYTHGVPKDVWVEIEAHYGDKKWFADEHVFAMAQMEDATAKAQEREDVPAGFEKIDPNNPNKVRGIGATIQVEGAPDLGR
jgi:hypothetical protein